MFNLLPEIRADIAQKTEPIHTVWKPDAAHPTTGKISYTLQSQISRDFIIPQGKYAKNSLPQAEPNVRLSAKAEFGIGDPSPLSFQERGIADDAILSMQPILDQRPKYQKFVSKGGSVGPLSLQLINGLPLAMDLFVQKKLSLFNKTVESDEQYICCIDGDTNSKTAPFDRSEHLVFYFSTLRRATVTTTNRQMIRDFEFDSLFPIGMEIEMKNGRLVCTNVLEDCQASQYTTHLDGAELIAVNSERVINLEEFQAAMIDAKKSNSIVLKMAAFKDGRGKLDTLYLHDFQSTTQVKSLLSNLFMHGTSHDTNESKEWSSDDDDDDDDDYDDEDGGGEDDYGDGGGGGVGGEEKSGNGSVAEVPEAKCVEPLPSTRSEGKDDARDWEEGKAIRMSTSRTFGSADSVYSNSRSSSSDDADARTTSRRRRREASSKSIDSDRIEDKSEKQDRPYEENLSRKFDAEVVVDEEGEGGMMAAKTLKAVEPATALAAEPKVRDEDEKTVDSESDSSWNKLTKVDEVFSFKSLVCVPPIIRCSEVSNFSRQWQAHMYWIDENGAMVEKGSLDAGTMTQQPCHPSHVWALVATAKLPPAKKSNYNSQSGTLAADSSCFLDESGSLGASTSSVQESSPAVLLIRPSRAALVSDKCTSIMWTPLTSLSITQRVYSKNERAAERSKSSEPNNSEMVSSPEMHVQLFDGPQRNSMGLLQSTAASVPTTSLHTLDRTKLVRWPRRKSKR